MARKQWTPQTDLTEADLLAKEKKKWQLGFRRFVLEGSPSAEYAPYFGLDSKSIRIWLERQFDATMTWENFGKVWQFEHVLPLAYLDLTNEADLKLGWHCINIRPERIDLPRERPSLAQIKQYFETLYQTSGLSVCADILERIERIPDQPILISEGQEQFLQANRKQIEAVRHFDQADFLRLHEGSSIDDLLLEKEILRKFG
jgi:hypothetical protein